MSSEVFYMGDDNKELCFKHAVQVAMNGHDIRPELEIEEPALDETGHWRIHECYMCD